MASQLVRWANMGTKVWRMAGWVLAGAVAVGAFLGEANAETAPAATEAKLTEAQMKRAMGGTGMDDWENYRWEREAEEGKLSKEEVGMLRKQKLVVTGRQCKQSFEPYMGGRVPFFVTSDSLLNGFHVLFEESMLKLEESQAPKLRGWVRTVWKELGEAEKLAAGEEATVTAARLRARVIVGVAMRLMKDEPTGADAEAAKLIAEEVRKVEAGVGMEKPEWLGKADAGFAGLDYSRFKVRGFYTRSEGLERYFRARAWLQAIPFRVDRDDELLTVLIVGRAAKETERGGWITPIREMVGQSDDLGIETAASYTRKERIDEIGEARKGILEDYRLRGGSRINDQVAYEGSVSVRILPAARLADAVMFGETTALRKRGFPSGLEVAGMVGSMEARRLLGDEVGGIVARHGKLLEEGLARRRSSVYEDYLGCLGELVKGPEKDAPAVFGSEAWRIKSCQTVLGGWSQMRHTYVLQAKENVLFMSATMKPTGFVEPVPEFYARMEQLAKRIAMELKEAKVSEESTLGVAAKLREGMAAWEEEGDEEKDFGRRAEAKRFAIGVASVLQEIEDRKDGSIHSSPPMKESLPRLRKVLGALESGEWPGDTEVAAALKGSDHGIRRLRMILGESPEVEELWGKFEGICRELRTLAHKQLRGVEWNREEEEFVKHYGERLAGVMLYGGNSYQNPRDDAPRIADVFSNPMEKKVLEVGIGRARVMYILYPWKGKDVLCVGAAFPYFEFTSAERLTDEGWQAKQDGTGAVEVPAWCRGIYAGRVVGPR